eukprot:scaffold26767_cov33-Tisochrysis_lutea.AAC.3
MEAAEPICWLLLLPETLLSHILGQLPEARSLGAAASSCSALRTAAVDDAVWLQASMHHAWRLRLRTGERPRDLCRRAKSAGSKQRIVLLGGCDGSAEALRGCDSYNVGARTWCNEQPLTVERDAPAVACNGSSITLLGGWNGDDEAIASVETASFSANAVPHRIDQMDPINNEWVQLPSLPRPLCFGAADIDAHDRLFFVGGGSSIFRGALCCREVRHSHGHDCPASRPLPVRAELAKLPC